MVNWGLSAELHRGGRKVGIVVGDRASDQVALNDYLLPDLRRAGVTPVVKTIAADPAETATTNAEAPLVVQELQHRRCRLGDPADPVQRLLPAAAGRDGQHYFPRLLFSGLRVEIQLALGLLPSPTPRRSTAKKG